MLCFMQIIAAPGKLIYSPLRKVRVGNFHNSGGNIFGRGLIHGYSSLTDWQADNKLISTKRATVFLLCVAFPLRSDPVLPSPGLPQVLDA
jgi:hypothetical protein